MNILNFLIEHVLPLLLSTGVGLVIVAYLGRRLIESKLKEKELHFSLQAKLANEKQSMASKAEVDHLNSLWAQIRALIEFCGSISDDSHFDRNGLMALHEKLDRSIEDRKPFITNEVVSLVNQLLNTAGPDSFRPSEQFHALRKIEDQIVAVYRKRLLVSPEL